MSDLSLYGTGRRKSSVARVFLSQGLEIFLSMVKITKNIYVEKL